jgi:hypothetical protein
MKKLNSSILMALILITSISVSLFSAYAVPELLVDVQPVKDHIDFNGVAKYQIELTNNREESMSIRIPTPRNNWDITVNPYAIDIAPKQSKIIDISIAPPKTINSGVYSIYFQFQENGNKIDYKYLHVTINEDSPVVEAKVKFIEETEVQEAWSEEFLVKSYSATIINKGNAEATGTWETKVTNIEQFFLNAEPIVEIEHTDDEVILNWDYVIPVDEQVIVSYTINYYPLAIAGGVIIFALTILGLYYMTRYKLVKTILHKKNGYIGVQLSIKNKTNKKQKNVVVEDYVPIPLMISREFGTMSPTAIRKKKDKLVLMWKFDELQPREERMLSYKMKSKLKVEGQIVIPPATIIQKDGKKTIDIVSKVKQN